MITASANPSKHNELSLFSEAKATTRHTEWAVAARGLPPQLILRQHTWSRLHLHSI